MTPRRIIPLALLMGVIGGIIGYAVASYLARIYIEITKPAAEIEVRDVVVYAAPYETRSVFDRVATVKQASDRVQYRVRIRAENVDIYKTCIAAGVFYNEIYYDCARNEYVFTVDRQVTLFNTFNIYIEATVKTRDQKGVITAEITFTSVP